jgi:hypothetical protein
MYDINNDDQFDQALTQIQTEMGQDMTRVLVDDCAVPLSSAISNRQTMITKVYLSRYARRDGDHDKAVWAARMCAESVLDALNTNTLAVKLPLLEYEIDIHKTGRDRISPTSGRVEEEIEFNINVKPPAISWKKVS